MAESTAPPSQGVSPELSAKLDALIASTQQLNESVKQLVAKSRDEVQGAQVTAGDEMSAGIANILADFSENLAVTAAEMRSDMASAIKDALAGFPSKDDFESIFMKVYESTGAAGSVRKASLRRRKPS